MHVAWRNDERPAWWLGCMFEVEHPEGEDGGRRESRRLERVLTATGAVRDPRVSLVGGQVLVTMLVRGEDEQDAAYRGLSVVDTAARQVPRLRLGELVRRSATRVGAATPPAAAGARG